MKVIVCSDSHGAFAAAEQLLEQQPFDVLAIDESLAGSSGVDFCMAIRGRYPGMTRIVMTNSPFTRCGATATGAATGRGSALWNWAGTGSSAPTGTCMA